MVNVRLDSKFDLVANKAVQSAISDVESKLGKNGRVLLRPSGTEPVLRVMVEGEDMDTVSKLAQELSDAVAVEVSGPS
jgi:phosphoglucosamine mutase